MSENKRFELRLCNNGIYYLWKNNELTDISFDKFNKESANELVDLLNELHEENQELNQSNEDARQILKKEFDFATAQRQKHLDDPVVANAYDIIRYDMRRALDKLGGYDD